VDYREAVDDKLHRSGNDLQSGDREMPRADDDYNLLCVDLLRSLQEHIKCIIWANCSDFYVNPSDTIDLYRVKYKNSYCCCDLQ
jgi:hypothetical protein